MIPGLPAAVLSLMPQCRYVLTERVPSDAPAVALADEFDASGLPDAPTPSTRTIVGLLHPYDAVTLSWAPEGLTADGAIVLTSRERLDLPGRCADVPLLARYVVTDHEGQPWRLMQRRVIGNCVSEYLGVPYCEPDCD